MYAKDIKVGMKVVPVIKTIEGPLGKSKEWAKAREAKQAFLYVTALDDKPGKKLVVRAAATKSGAGERFSTIDLRAHPWKGWECRENPGATLKAKAPKAKAKKSAAKKAAPKKAKAKKSAAKFPIPQRVEDDQLVVE